MGLYCRGESHDYNYMYMYMYVLTTDPPTCWAVDEKGEDTTEQDRTSPRAGGPNALGAVAARSCDATRCGR